MGQAGRPGRRDGEREGFALTGYVGGILREEAELLNARCRLMEVLAKTEGSFRAYEDQQILILSPVNEKNK